MQGEFWKLGALTDAVLIEGLQRVVGAGQRTLAALIAHLCEVENRRIHLDAGYPSMFAYCTGRLGFSEDEASRRIDVARLARRAPIVFTRLAEGRLSLSAAALLRSHLLAPNLAELVEAVSGRSVQGAREALAELFPSPDVATSIRKLPPPRTTTAGAPPFHAPRNGEYDCQATLGSQLFEHFAQSEELSHAPGKGLEAGAASPLFDGAARSEPAGHAGGEQLETACAPSPPFEHTPSCKATSSHARAAERAPTPILPPAVPATKNPLQTRPLSPGRYKVQFTADATLKEKLELSRDLLRHAVPSGDLANIINRALDLLIDDIMRRRFGKRRGRSARNPDTSRSPADTNVTPSPAPTTSRSPADTNVTPSPAPTTSHTPPAIKHLHGDAPPEPAPSPAHDITAATGRPAHRAVVERSPTDPPPEPAPSPAHDITAATGRPAHRAVVERDGLQCTWRGPDGTRCTSRAWLERDHRHGRGLGGPSNAGNLRHLCKAHNRRAAEHVYGTHHIERAIRRKQTRPNQPTHPQGDPR